MAALPSSVKKDCGGCDCGSCGVREGASSIFHHHVFNPLPDALNAFCAAAFVVLFIVLFVVLVGLPILTVEEFLAEIGLSLIGVLLAVGEQEWGTIHLFEPAVTAYVGNPLRAFPILFAGPKLVEPVP